jgi:hypothetical protein
MPKAKINRDELKVSQESDIADDVTTPDRDLSDTQPVDSTDNQPIVNDDYSYDTSASEPAVATATVAGTSQNGKNLSRHYIIEAVLLVIVIMLALFVWSLNSDKHNLTKEVASLNANPQALVQKQTQSLITAVGQLMQLPQGETPTVAAVTNVAAARKQSAFFNNAQNGDKVLLYVKSSEAILYRPSTNKIILVAPLSFSGTTSGTTTGSSTAN